MQSPVEKLVRNRLNYVQLMETVGGATPGSGKHKQVLIDTVEYILTAFKSVKKLSVEVGIEIQKMIAASPLSEDQKSVVLGAQDEKINFCPSDAVGLSLIHI